MPKMWVDVIGNGGERRIELPEGLTRLGGVGCDVQLEIDGPDQLHLWSDPPKLIHVGRASTPRLNGETFGEAELNDGDRVEWQGCVLRFGIAEDVLREIPDESAGADPSARGGAVPAPAQRAWMRVASGLQVELGIAPRRVARRWQQAVQAGEFDPDACARELCNESAVALDDSRLLERAARLQRDLLMAPLQRGLRSAGRRARRATRSGLAYLLAQLIAISVYTLILVAILLLVRVKYDFSLDDLFDRWIEVVSP